MNYRAADLIMRLRFLRSGGGLASCDFRPHFDGFLHNAWVMILPEKDMETTRQLAVGRYGQVLTLLRRIRWCFAPGDRVQVIVGLHASVKQSGRQILKGWIPAARLKDVKRGIDIFELEKLGGGLAEMEGWDRGVFPDQGRHLQTG